MTIEEPTPDTAQRTNLNAVFGRELARKKAEEYELHKEMLGSLGNPFVKQSKPHE